VRKLLPLIVLLFATPFAAGEASAKTWDTRCGNAAVPLPDWIAGCSAMIDSGELRGRELSVAYARRGHAFTQTRDLKRAADDLDRAVEADPSYALAFVNRANYFNVTNALRPRRNSTTTTARSPTSTERSSSTRRSRLPGTTAA